MAQGTKTKEIWGRRTEEQKRAIARKISAANKGKKATPETLEKRRQSMIRNWSSLTKEQKAKRITAMQEKSQIEKSKKKRLESFKRWQEKNPGLPGSTGLTPGQKVKLFFASHPDATDLECARAIGRTVYMVSKHRAAGRRPTKRELLWPIVMRTPHAEIWNHLRGNMPECPKCKEIVPSIYYDKSRFNGRWVGVCKCRHRFVLPAGARPRRPPIRHLNKSSVLTFLDLVAAGKPLYSCYKKCGLPHNRGEKLSEELLEVFGEYSSKDWRRTNNKKKRKEK